MTCDTGQFPPTHPCHAETNGLKYTMYFGGMDACGINVEWTEWIAIPSAFVQCVCTVGTYNSVIIIMWQVSYFVCCKMHLGCRLTTISEIKLYDAFNCSNIWVQSVKYATHVYGVGLQCFLYNNFGQFLCCIIWVTLHWLTLFECKITCKPTCTKSVAFIHATGY